VLDLLRLSRCDDCVLEVSFLGRIFAFFENEIKEGDGNGSLAVRNNVHYRKVCEDCKDDGCRPRRNNGFVAVPHAERAESALGGVDGGGLKHV
jgi:hypothetical protein